MLIGILEMIIFVVNISLEDMIVLQAMIQDTMQKFRVLHIVHL